MELRRALTILKQLYPNLNWNIAYNVVNLNPIIQSYYSDTLTISVYENYSGINQQVLFFHDIVVEYEDRYSRTNKTYTCKTLGEMESIVGYLIGKKELRKSIFIQESLVL